MAYKVGICRAGKMLFKICPDQPDYQAASVACVLLESLAAKVMTEGDYVACQPVEWDD